VNPCALLLWLQHLGQLVQQQLVDKATPMLQFAPGPEARRRSRGTNGRRAQPFELDPVRRPSLISLLIGSLVFQPKKPPFINRKSSAINTIAFTSIARTTNSAMTNRTPTPATSPTRPYALFQKYCGNGQRLIVLAAHRSSVQSCSRGNQVSVHLNENFRNIASSIAIQKLAQGSDLLLNPRPLYAVRPA
jgi:hypothetical protein